MPLTSLKHFLILVVALATVPRTLVLAALSPIEIARNAAVVLQETWYNGNNGLYNSTGWWNSANAITTLADLTAVDPAVLDRTSQEIFNNTFNRAQQSNVGVLKTSPTFECDGIHDNCPKQDPKLHSKQGWLNGYFDDEAWWALAWITVWDLTQDDAYLDAATSIFSDMVNNGLNGTCGGLWWNKAHTQINSITTELFISVAAHLANRKPNGDYYLAWAKKQWQWFVGSGLINESGSINDALDLSTCKNPLNAVWTYNQGVILGALVELDRADPNDGTYIPKAVAIANAALSNRQLVDDSGILHDNGEPNLGSSGFSFKGIFVRNLGILNAKVRDSSFKRFIQKQADSIIARNMNSDGQFGPVWDGPVDTQYTNAATHASAMDVLVAASTLDPDVGGYIGSFRAKR